MKHISSSLPKEDAPFHPRLSHSLPPSKKEDPHESLQKAVNCLSSLRASDLVESLDEIKSLALKLSQQILFFGISPSSLRPNLPSRQRIILQQFRNDTRIVIKPADKNLGITVMDRSWYVFESFRQLRDVSTYTPVDSELTLSNLVGSAFASFCLFLSSYSNATKTLSPTELKHINDYRLLKMSNFIARRALASAFYVLPKLHKSPVVGRPIVASHSSFTASISVLLDVMLQPFLSKIPSYISDSFSLVRLLESSPIPPSSHVTLFSADVESLYPSIPIDEGITRVCNTLQLLSPDITRDRLGFIRGCLSFVLKNNYVSFDGAFFKQIQGTAMGTSVAVCFACLFMCSVESPWLDKFRRSLFLFRRYIDDIFGVALAPPADVKAMLDNFNSLHPNIRITYKIGPSVDFLDLTLSLGSRFSEQRLLDILPFHKPTNKYLYIPYSSFHPRHVKSNFIIGEIRRHIRNCSDASFFHKWRRTFFFQLRERGYPPKFLLPLFNSPFTQYSVRPTILSKPAAAAAAPPAPLPPPPPPPPPPPLAPNPAAARYNPFANIRPTFSIYTPAFARQSQLLDALSHILPFRPPVLILGLTSHSAKLRLGALLSLSRNVNQLSQLHADFVRLLASHFTRISAERFNLSVSSLHPDVHTRINQIFDSDSSRVINALKHPKNFSQFLVRAALPALQPQPPPDPDSL